MINKLLKPGRKLTFTSVFILLSILSFNSIAFAHTGATQESSCTHFVTKECKKGFEGVGTAPLGDNRSLSISSAKVKATSNMAKSCCGAASGYKCISSTVGVSTTETSSENGTVTVTVQANSDFTVSCGS